MSTYLYLECLDHDPPLRADGESGQHLYDLPRIRNDIRRRDFFVAAEDTGFYNYGHHFIQNTASFLAQHPKCRIGIRDEYGREHALEDDDE